MAEPGGRGGVGHGHRLALEPRQLPLQVGEEHVRHVVREATAHDDAQAARSSRFLGNVYAGTCQPRSRNAFETSKTVKFSMSSATLNAKTGSSSPRVISSNGPSSPISPESRVATSRA